MNRHASLPMPAFDATAGRAPAARPSSSWLPWAIVAVVVGGYSLTLAVNHTEGEDSGHYIEVVRNTNVGELFYPNHVLFASFNWVVYKAWQLAGYAGDAAVPMQLNNVIAAAVALLLLFRIAQRLGMADFHAVLCVAATAVSYGFWWYAVEAETYILPLPFILLCVLMLLNLAERPFAVRTFFALGCVFSLAVLLHQQHVLLMPILIAAIGGAWHRRRATIPTTAAVGDLTVFVATSAAIIGCVYVAAAVFAGDCGSFAEIVEWSKGTARNGLWTPWSFTNPIKSAVGIVRTVCGLHFLYGFDTFHNTMAGAFPDRFLADDRFLAESIAPPVRWLCLGTALLAATSGMAAAAGSVFPLRHNRNTAAVNADARFAFWMFAAGTMIAYAVFNTLWEPQNIEFWVMLLPIAWLAATLRLAEPETPRWANWAAVAFVVLLMITNLLGSVRPQNAREGDYWYAANEYLIREARPADLIVTDGGWISDNCLRTNTRASVVSVRKTRPAELAEIIGRHRDGRVFISSWALKPDEAIVAVTPHADRDEAALSLVFEPIRGRLVKLDDNGFQVIWELRPKKGTGTVGKRLNHFKTRLSTEPVPIF